MPVQQTLNTRFYRRLVEIDTLSSGCWLWPGQVLKGYGIIWEGPILAAAAEGRARKKTRAHRVSYELFNGPIPEGMEIDHVCHTNDDDCPAGDACLHRRCVNPDHLEAVSHMENVFRRDERFRRTGVRAVKP